MPYENVLDEMISKGPEAKPNNLWRSQANAFAEAAMVRISIITVSYNSAETIHHTLDSVKDQDHINYEHLLIDGHSTDNTLSIIKSYPHVSKCISEKDAGIYDAMNKGLQHATGDVIGILNSDDFFAHNHVLSDVAACFAKKQTDTVYGDLQYVNAKNPNAVVRHWKSGCFKRSKFYYGWMPPHPTFFAKRSVYEQCGLFNLSLKMSADYELMLRILFKYGFRATYLPQVLVKMRTGGISNSSLKNRLYANHEDKRAWRLNGLHPYFFTLYLKPMRKVFQFI